ncbi:Flp pilus assembly protein, TadC [Bifidobacterium bohemicum DSM 22767]|uniref:Flp pilus assembly protein, TadC n=1 Tax=Bifidobacterium bohemicum DSM 22767 TaxID=1437606 RepID=A0A086ZE47_9BIFI|nr:Flp pilus assembly protein, TadC [Bifidobacterium bohemicum DSM 22767]
MIEPWLAGCCAALAAYLWHSGADGRGRLASFGDEDVEISLVVMLQMLAVALRHGASITRAFEVVGGIVSGRFGVGLCKVAVALKEGFSWNDAWFSVAVWPSGDDREDAVMSGQSRFRIAEKNNEMNRCSRSADDEAFAIVEEALRDSWTLGVPPDNRLKSTMEQIDVNQRTAIDQAASKLSISLLTPTALCFLPAFMLIGVIPCIGSFVR